MYKIFEKELNYITNEELKAFIIECLEKAPKYFYHVPASSSGQYHPKQDLGEGGLIRHTKAVVQVAMDLIRCRQFNPSYMYKDEIISACILHDVIKNGFEDSEHTLKEHPLLASKFIYNLWYKNEKYTNINGSINAIMDMIKSHMGIWNEDSEGYQILPLPNTEIEKLVHLADYIASRKYVDMSLLEE